MTIQGLAAVAAFGLPSGCKFPAAPLDSLQFDQFLVAVRSNRLTGLLVDAIDSGAMPAADTQIAQANALHLAMMTSVLRLDGLLLDMHAALSDIPHRVLKGCASAHLDYDDASLRPYGDVDLLVHGEQIGACLTSLQQLGIRRSTPELRPGFDRRFGKGATLRAPNGTGVDVHRTFLAGPFAFTIEADALFQRSEAFDIGGSQLLALGREERFIHSCFTAAVADLPPSLHSLRDVVQQNSSPSLDHGRVLDLAGRWSATGVVAEAVRTSFDVLQIQTDSALSGWARTYVPSPRERRLTAPYRATHLRWGRQAVAALPEIQGARNRCAYLLAVVAPRRSALLGRGQTTWGRVAAAGRALVTRPKASDRQSGREEHGR